MILSIDPGRDKTGVAIYDPKKRQVFFHQVILTTDFFQQIFIWSKENAFQLILLGDGTLSAAFFKKIQRLVPEIPIILIDESFSTLEARQLYFALYPPKGLKSIIPKSLQTPQEPIDDLVAIILLERYLGEMPKIYE